MERGKDSRLLEEARNRIGIQAKQIMQRGMKALLDRQLISGLGPITQNHFNYNYFEI